MRISSPTAEGRICAMHWSSSPWCVSAIRRWDLAAGNEPDNNIEPENLSDFERKHLKDAFQILSNAQKFLRYHYQPGRFN